MCVTLIENLVRGADSGSLAAGSEGRKHLLVGGPQRLRLDESLVVEARAKESPDRLISAANVIL